MIRAEQYYAHAFWPESEHTESVASQLQSENEVVSAALSLGAESVAGWSREEAALAALAVPCSREAARQIRRDIRDSRDPLGNAFCSLRSSEVRRDQGATYTPVRVAEAMVSWAAAAHLPPLRVVDPGAGSARFLLAAAREFPKAQLLGIEIDPLAAIIARANLAAAGLATRSEVILGDYREVTIPAIEGKTLFIGNPPYVRHHKLSVEAKVWLSAQAKKIGFSASQLSGLHVHFFLATVLKAKWDDFGIFITSSEWLDVNYGRLVRELFLNDLGGQGITVVEPKAQTFTDAITTAAITQFTIGSRPDRIRMRRSASADQPSALAGGPWLSRERFQAESRWSHLTRRAKEIPEGFIELGEICRVHRGQVTGANRVWDRQPS